MEHKAAGVRVPLIDQFPLIFFSQDFFGFPFAGKTITRNFCIMLILPPEAGIQAERNDTSSGFPTSFDESYNIREG
jgi:hypothetical protein